MGIKDNKELALQDWLGSAAFDRPDDEDVWGKQWAQAYVDWAAGGKRDYVRSLGLKFLPFVGWATARHRTAHRHPASIPSRHQCTQCRNSHPRMNTISIGRASFRERVCTYV